MTARICGTMLAGIIVAGALMADEPRAPLPADLAAVPAEALGFVHIPLADIWKSDAFNEMRETVLKAGDKALQGFDKRFVPTPSSIDRLTIVFAPRDPELQNEPDVFAILSVNKAFDKDEVLKSAMPNGVEKKTTNGSYWVDAKPETAVAFINDRVIVFGPIPAIAAFIDRRANGPSLLSDALHAAASKKQITMAVNLTLIPKKNTKDLPPPARPLLNAKTAMLTLDLGGSAEISLDFADERAAAAGLVALEDLAKMGRELLKKSREEMLNTVLGDGKTAPLEKLPESAMALVGLGGTERLDRFLADPPLKRDGRTVKFAMHLPNLNYAATVPVAIGLLLPAVQKVREAAARASSTNNMKMLGLAMNNYNDTMNSLPPAAICDKNGKPLLSWRVAILPFIEQQNLYSQFKLDEPWEG